ncbi:DUF2157 domain-containing protein [Chitinimonas sp. BJB300]|uniref:DUF2157 domain-containing protein n=1 Tax=Chitinimonas sp. BJB300 TaxID=1559339 RepID=UPI000C10B428|nr:DUF2157 domain-containing protein [Chitinimonas sp. BJB300]PHV13190.1 DUF2157 domain-containing protein [Chitinimonas sp. BJB300]TSJ87174.1 DUF2157 domain-containing protein [Chitinimonas sp. BJB300]
MKLHRADLTRAEEVGLLQTGQAEALWAFLAMQPQTGAQFRFAHILYYLGGMIAIAAMSLFMTVGYQTWGPGSLTVFAVSYGFVAWRLGVWFFDAKHLPIPAGILFTLTIVLVPLAVYGILAALGHWDGGGRYSDYHYYIDWRWLLLELATLAAAAVMLWRYRLPFMIMPVAVTLWYMSMDVAAWIAFGVGADDIGSYYGELWHLRQFVSLGFGLIMLGLALRIDLATRHDGRDFAFWLYLFGLLAFWGALSSMDSGSQWGKFIYCVLNLGLIFIGAVLARRVFAVFGGLGVAGYLGYLAWDVFKDSLPFAFALSLIGLAVVFAGVWWNKHGEGLGKLWRRQLSPQLAELIESRT